MAKNRKKSPKSLRTGIKKKKARTLSLGSGLLTQAQELHRRGLLDEAERVYRSIGTEDPCFAESLHGRGVIESQRGHHQAAIDLINRAIEKDGSVAQFHDNLGVVYKHMNKPDQAIGHHQAAIELDPGYASAHFNLAVSLHTIGRVEEAVKQYQRTLEGQPDNPAAHDNLAVGLNRLGSYEEAIFHHKQAVDLQPTLIGAYNNWANTYMAMNKHDEAESQYRRVLDLDPGHAEATFNLALIRMYSARMGEGLDLFEKAANLAPTDANVLSNLAYTLASLCSWDRLDEICRRLASLIEGDDGQQQIRRIVPFLAIALPFTLDQIKRISEGAAAKAEESAGSLRFSLFQESSERLRIGYISPDFCSHPVGFTVDRMFTHHDSARFEITGYSIRNIHDQYREHIESSCDRFVDLTTLSHQQAAQKIHADGIDILVDFAGYTTSSRPEILALRPSPVQVSFFGYPCTMGADFIDYRIVVEDTAPEALSGHYREKLVTLPGTFIAFEPRDLPLLENTRSDFGLPESEAVFCYFNAGYRIDREIFDAWMEILRRTPGSVLWLKETEKTLTENLRREAKVRDIDPDRLVFTDFARLSDNWIHRLADLWLDTPFSVGTAGILCQWAGVPVLTIRGDKPQNLTGTAIVAAAGMDEMIMEDMAAYMEKAVCIGNSQTERSTLRARLLEKRLTAPLFDQARFIKNVERAYEGMWKQRLSGEAVASFKVTEYETTEMGEFHG